jgi:predicted nucleic acid-binding protein
MARAKGPKRGKKPAPEFVLDNSIVMAWIFEDEMDANAEAVLDRLASTRAVAPSLWPLEVANALLVGERRKRIAEAKLIQWLNVLGALPIDIDAETAAHAWSDTLTLARGHKLSAYDAAYLELAIRRRLPLATLDGPLKAAATAVGVPLYTPRRNPSGESRD